MVRSEGADRRGTARALAYTVNGAALALMVMVFSTTGGITGAEVGIAGGSAVVAQKVLEALFSDDAVRRMSGTARERLTQRVEAFFAEHAAHLHRPPLRHSTSRQARGPPLRERVAAVMGARDRLAELTVESRAPLPAAPEPSVPAQRRTGPSARPTMRDPAARLVGWRPMRARRGGGSPALDADTVRDRCRGLERSVSVAADRVGGDAVAGAREVLARASERLALTPDLTVVALAGSTGAGKSSLFNVLVGEPVATVAVTRPTTDRPMAGLWTGSTDAAALLEWLAVPLGHRVATEPDDPMTGMVLLDLPDHDSTAGDHREQVDRIVARADVMVWVLDPQKYADALVHDSYLARYARHSELTLVLLNQVDQLSEPDARACLAHLRGLVAADGLPDAQVLGVSARTGAGAGRAPSRAGRRSWLDARPLSPGWRRISRRRPTTCVAPPATRARRPGPHRRTSAGACPTPWLTPPACP